jgi:hypothetical protein
MRSRKVLGRIKLDSGRILLCDPCRTDGRINFMQESFWLSRTDEYQLPNNQAVIVPAGLANESFDVEVVIEEHPSKGPEICEIILLPTIASIDNQVKSDATIGTFSGIRK